MNPEILKATEQLVSATRSGNLAQAYTVAARTPFQDLPLVAVEAGFSCISTRNRRDFLIHLQRQIANAARHRTDGYGLRKLARRGEQ